MKLSDPLNRRDAKILVGIAVVCIVLVFTIPLVDKYDNPFGPGSIPSRIYEGIKSAHKVCLKCDHAICKAVQESRGDEYYLYVPEDEQPDDRYCLVTFWNLSHVFSHAVVGFLVPKTSAFFITVAAGLAWETFEYFSGNYQDFLDIGYNSLGFWMGVGLRKAWDSRRSKRANVKD